MREFVREIFAGVYAPFTGKLLASFALLPILAMSIGSNPSIGLTNIVDEGALYSTETSVEEVDKSEVKEPDAGNEPATSPKVATAPVGIADNTVSVKYDLTIGGKVATNVVPVNLNNKGAVDVPSYGAGYYDYYGAHLLVGHNPGVFSGLLSVVAGDVVEFRGENYVVTGSKIYNYDPSVGVYDENNQMTENGQMMSDSLYSGGGTGLNLMTCYGAYLPQHGTYNQRLVVFTQKM